MRTICGDDVTLAAAAAADAVVSASHVRTQIVLILKLPAADAALVSPLRAVNEPVTSQRRFTLGDVRATVALVNATQRRR